MTISAVLIALASAFFLLSVNSYNAVEFSREICVSGWQGKVTYSMLSDELKKIISEEEFSDSTPEARMAMYRKLEDLVLDSSEHFYCSTSWWKTPCFELYTIDGITYSIDIEIDFNKCLNGIKAVNFTCHIL